ncbi:hypothetical protein AVEN_142980-1 [Araneus ventricosus]|uniref:Uncharacterized protein n=1 Tax=Araneus ventricosus TaxID=182803 RepID=A0A4Y2PTI8_ARAVE|nr:hypothetical protein AVEN_142980-1 [Araneus ventricosus]
MCMEHGTSIVERATYGNAGNRNADGQCVEAAKRGRRKRATYGTAENRGSLETAMHGTVEKTVMLERATYGTGKPWVVEQANG